MVFGLTAATALIRSTWLPGNSRVSLSASSVAVFSSVPTNTTATSADAANAIVSLSIGASWWGLIHQVECVRPGQSECIDLHFHKTASAINAS